MIYQQGVRVICAQTQTIGAMCSKQPTKSFKWCFEILVSIWETTGELL